MTTVAESHPNCPTRPTQPTDSVAVAIPAYQAAASVGDIVRRSRKLLPDVLVIDDGSSDATAMEARRAGAEVISLSKNSGKGRALQTAFRELFRRGFGAVITIDADGQHMPEEIPRLLEAAGNGAHLVLGARDHLFEHMAHLRRISNRLSSLAISILAGQRLRDIQTGFRWYSHHLIDTLGFPESRFEAESAVIVRASRRGLRIVSVPVKLGQPDGRATSHYRPLADSLRIGFAVTRARLELRR